MENKMGAYLWHNGLCSLFIMGVYRAGISVQHVNKHTACVFVFVYVCERERGREVALLATFCQSPP